MPLWFAFAVLAEGLVVSVIAQSVLRQVSVAGAIALSLVGAYLGGVIAWLFINTGIGLVFALLGATALLYTRARFLEHR